MNGPTTDHRAGRMLDGLLRSENEKGKVLLTVELKKDGVVTALHDTFALRKWEGRRGRFLSVELPDTADWYAEPRVKPIAPLSMNLDTGEIVASRDERVTPLLAYAAQAALRYAFSGELPTPANGTVSIMEQDFCGACGMRLKDPESLRVGIGPDCEKKLTGVRRTKRTRKMTAKEGRNG